MGAEGEGDQRRRVPGVGGGRRGTRSATRAVASTRRGRHHAAPSPQPPAGPCVCGCWCARAGGGAGLREAPPRRAARGRHGRGADYSPATSGTTASPSRRRGSMSAASGRWVVTYWEPASASAFSPAMTSPGVPLEPAEVGEARPLRRQLRRVPRQEDTREVGPGDRLERAADRRAVPAQHRVAARHRGRVPEQVAHVGVPRDEPERDPLAAAADQEGRAGALDGRRLVAGVLDRVVLAAEGRGPLRQPAVDDLDGFLEHLQPLLHARERPAAADYCGPRLNRFDLRLVVACSARPVPRTPPGR